MNEFLPEGTGSALFNPKDEKELTEAFERRLYLEAKPYRCDSEHNLHFIIGGVHAVMPREECAEGIADGSVRDIAIISRVNKPTGFYITDLSVSPDGEKTARLSRLVRQTECRENYIDKLVPGDVIDAKITRLESFGAFCDIGSGIISLLPVDSISVSRIPSADARFRNSQSIKAVVKNIDEKGRILLSHKELLGTWEENAALFSTGETVTGIVRSTESYGVFVELTPNLAGLAEFTPLARAGQTASVYIKNINPEKMKIKLIIVDTEAADSTFREPKYFISEGHIDFWRYSPECSERLVCTSFN